MELGTKGIDNSKDFSQSYNEGKQQSFQPEHHPGLCRILMKNTGNSINLYKEVSGYVNYKSDSVKDIEGNDSIGKITVTRNLGGIEGLMLIEPGLFDDSRGFFSEVFNQQEFGEEGLETAFVQDNESFSRKGVLRGLHVNIAHPQGKLIHVIFGEIFDVSIDLRRDSPTYKQCYGIRLSGENHKLLYIPEGFGHGYLATTDAYVHFKVTTHYYPKDEIGFSWNSKEFHIDWPISNPIQNDKDKSSPDFSELMI